MGSCILEPRNKKNDEYGLFRDPVAKRNQSKEPNFHETKKNGDARKFPWLSDCDLVVNLDIDVER